MLGVPVFNTVSSGRGPNRGGRERGFRARFAFAADAACEASAAGVKLVVVISEHIPVTDMVRTKALSAGPGHLDGGPQLPGGDITPAECKVGIMPGYIHQPGKVGLVSRSGTLTYEVVHQLTQAGLGQSTCIGIGGDPIIGLNFTRRCSPCSPPIRTPTRW